MKRTLLVFLALLYGCKEKTDTPVVPVTKIDFAISRAEVFPLQVFKIDLTEASSQKSIKGKLGTVDFEANQIDTKTYAFMVPATLTQGTYDLQITDGKSSYPVKIKTATVIASPADYTQTQFDAAKSILNGRLKSIQDSLVKKNLTTQQSVNQERELITTNLKTASDKFNLLSEADKKKCVAIIEANRLIFDQANQALGDVNFQITKTPNGKTSTLCADGSSLEKIKCQITNFSAGLIKINDAIQSLSIPKEFETDPSIVAALAVLKNVTGLQAMIEAKNIGDKLLKVPFILADQSIQITANNLPITEFSFNSGIEMPLNLGIGVRNIQEAADTDSANPLNKDLVKNFKQFLSNWDQVIGSSLTDKPAFAPLTKEIIAPISQSDVSVEVIGNTSVSNVFTLKDGILYLTFTNTGTTDQTIDFKITYKYDGSEATVTKKAIVAKAIVLNDTTWDVTVVYSAELSWHANVTFKADGSTIYEETAYPGQYTSYGQWTLTGNKIHWILDKAREKLWSFDGIVTGNKISGTFDSGKRVWTAVKL